MSRNIKKIPSIKIFVYYYLPLLLWMGVIFYFSSQSGSGYPIKDWQFYAQRKGAHIFEYFILSFLFLRIIFAQKIKGRVRGIMGRRGLAYLAAFVFSYSWAVFDELHQLFVFGREGKITDVGIDTVGIILAILVYWILKNSPFRKGGLRGI